MVDLTTTWLGLQLQSPLVVAASPLSRDVGAIATAVSAGAGAVVMYSLFEEQLVQEQLAAMFPGSQEDLEVQKFDFKTAWFPIGVPIDKPMPGEKFEAQLFDARFGERQADQSSPVGRHEIDRVGRRHLRGDDQVPLIFAVLVIDQDEHPAVARFLDNLLDRDERGAVVVREEEHFELAQRLGRRVPVGILKVAQRIGVKAGGARQDAILERAPQGVCLFHVFAPAPRPLLLDHDRLGVLRAVDLLDPRRTGRVLLRKLAAFLDERVDPRVGVFRRLAFHVPGRRIAQRADHGGHLLRGHPVHPRLGRVLGAVLVVGHLVDFVEQEDRVAARRLPHELDDLAGKGADVGAAMAADFRLVAHATQ